MDVIVTYQQDTVKVKNLINQAPQNRELKSVVSRKKPASILDIPEREQAAELSEKKTYTPDQIRNWRILQENKLLINNSKYITPLTDVNFIQSEKPDPGFVLPIRLRNTTGTDWLTLLIFFGIVLFASIRVAYAKYMGHLFLSLFNYSTSVRMLQEKNYPVFHGAFRLEAIFYISLSIFVFQILHLLKWENAVPSPSYFFMILGIVLLYFYVKKLMYLMLGSLFEARNETREYLFNMDNFNRSTGLLLLPIVILISFAPTKTPVFIVFAGIAILISSNLILLQRGIFILLKKQFSIFYLFLYLCTLEFLPLLLIYKVVVVE
ncbi:DUF4271 domain-containing protein [Prolixibacteraceae bacterium Z1-6]|uniref:DUF4271 domain-containing protein n=1 Tax=Draconibacterium aestuarii TaxID=2998507 RepID=A0A9X3F618_9BACT|nr:DUF4271 domain-containing protein [Prolixibacteraceae bacterium Z1-6]